MGVSKPVNLGEKTAVLEIMEEARARVWKVLFQYAFNADGPSEGHPVWNPDGVNHNGSRGRWELEMTKFAMFPVGTMTIEADGKPTGFAYDWIHAEMSKADCKDDPPYWLFLRCSYLEGPAADQFFRVPLVRVGLGTWHTFSKNALAYVCSRTLLARTFARAD